MSGKDNLTPTRFVRGGQSTQHWFRMAGQVLTTFTISWLLIFCITWVFLLLQNFTMAEIRFVGIDFVVRYIHAPLRNIDYPVNTYGLEWLPEGITAGEYLNTPELLERVEGIVTKCKYLFVISHIPGAICGLIVVIIYARSGSKLGQTAHQRGTKLVSQKELLQWSRDKWKVFYKQRGKDAGGPQYTIAGIPFPPENVMAQTGIFGTVGVGKTVAFKELLNTIRAEKGRAIVYDRMGTLVRDFYDPERGDKIVNPFDARSVSWSPFYEATDIASFAQMAEVLIPIKADAPDPFWQASARLLFESTARRLFERGDGNNISMREAIALMPDEELIELIDKTPAAQLVNDKNPKTAANIRTNLITELRFFEYLRDDGERFSIRDWVKDESIEEGFIFLSGDTEHAAATRNVISACLEIASNALMTCESGVDEPKIWFIVDELPTLNRLPFIEKSLAEIRQYGGAYVLGFQLDAQLREIYGKEGATIIKGVTNNRLIFNTPDAETAENSAKSLGLEDVVDQRHNITMGAHATRDGVGYSEQRAERYIVTPSEIQSLPKLEGYLRFGYDAPAAKVHFTPVQTKGTNAQPFIEYQGEGFASGSLALKKPEDSESPAMPVAVKRFPMQELKEEERMALFEEWKLHWRKKSITSHLIQPFEQITTRNPTEEYVSAWWDQKNAWNIFYESWVLGAPIEKIDPRMEVHKASKDLLRTLEKVLPPYPAQPPGTDIDDETLIAPAQSRKPEQQRPAQQAVQVQTQVSSPNAAEADAVTHGDTVAAKTDDTANPADQPNRPDDGHKPKPRRVSTSIKSELPSGFFSTASNDLFKLQGDEQ